MASRKGPPKAVWINHYPDGTCGNAWPSRKEAAEHSSGGEHTVVRYVLAAPAKPRAKWKR